MSRPGRGDARTVSLLLGKRRPTRGHEHPSSSPTGDSQFRSLDGQDTLARLPLLETTLAIDPAERSTNQLYSAYRQPKWTHQNVRLVPYFAWGNRGRGEMSVWLPVLP